MLSTKIWVLAFESLAKGRNQRPYEIFSRHCLKKTNQIWLVNRFFDSSFGSGHTQNFAKLFQIFFLKIIKVANNKKTHNLISFNFQTHLQTENRKCLLKILKKNREKIFKKILSDHTLCWWKMCSGNLFPKFWKKGN